MKYFNCPMSSSLFSCFQGNTKYESSFFADTCTRRVPIFGSRQDKSIIFKSAGMIPVIPWQFSRY